MAEASELIAGIVDDLMKVSPNKRNDVNFVVCGEVDMLKQILAAEPSWGLQADNLEYARQVESLVRKLLRTIEGAPEGTRRTLLAFGACSSRPSMPSPEEIVASNTAEHYGRFLRTALQDLQNGCDIILDPKNKNKIGDYHTLNRTKRFCAKYGFELMVGLEAGQPTDGNPFRSITNSLYEIVAPAEAEAWRQEHDDLDLRRPCKTVLSGWRKDPAYLQQHTEMLKLSFARMIAQKSASSV